MDEAARQLSHYNEGRTEAEVAADVIVCLFESRILAWNAEMARRVSDKTGVPLELLRSVWVARERGVRYRAPRGCSVAGSCAICGNRVEEPGERYCSKECKVKDWASNTPVDEMRAQPARPAPGPAKRSRSESTARGIRDKSTTFKKANPRPGVTRRCARCGEVKSVGEFPWKNEARGWLRSYCDPCWKARQAEGYISVAQREALSRARLEFKADQRSGTVGLACETCGWPIDEGDPVIGDTHVRHKDCEQGSG